MAVVHVLVKIENVEYPGLLLDWRRVEGIYGQVPWYGRVLYVTGQLPYRLVRESWIPAERIRPIEG